MDSQKKKVGESASFAGKQGAASGDEDRRNAAPPKNNKKSGAPAPNKTASGAALHANHRQRVRNRYFQQGLEGMEDHQVLEMLLFYSIPRRDTNELAHMLLNVFGSFANVFDAPVDLLTQVPGVGRETAYFIKLFPAIWSRYRMSAVAEVRSITGRAEMEKIMRPMFTDPQQEQLCCVFLDGGGRILKKSVYNGGSHRYIEANVPEILRDVIMSHADCIAVAHSHPSGYAAPSTEDIRGTLVLAEKLKLLNVRLLDHMIVAANEVYFLSSCNKIPSDVFLLSAFD